MTFEIMGRGFENGPTERYEFKVPLDKTQGPSWSTDVLVEIGPKFFQSVTRCRAIHPDHDCQCTGQVDHRGAWWSKHHCWHTGSGKETASTWVAWKRGNRDLERVPEGRTLKKAGPVLINTDTGATHIEQAHVAEAPKAREALPL